jgi:hypothetical protein
MTDQETTVLYKLAKAGEEAGITIDQMIAMLRADLSMMNLLYLIERDQPPPVFVPNSSRWIL